MLFPARMFNEKKKVRWAERTEDREGNMKQGKGAINSIPLNPSPPPKLSTILSWWSKNVKKWRWSQAMKHLCAMSISWLFFFFAWDRRSWSGSKNRVTSLNLSFISVYSSLTFFHWDERQGEKLRVHFSSWNKICWDPELWHLKIQRKQFITA